MICPVQYVNGHSYLCFFSGSFLFSLFFFFFLLFFLNSGLFFCLSLFFFKFSLGFSLFLCLFSPSLRLSRFSFSFSLLFSLFFLLPSSFFFSPFLCFSSCFFSYLFPFLCCSLKPFLPSFCSFGFFLLRLFHTSIAILSFFLHILARMFLTIEGSMELCGAISLSSNFVNIRDRITREIYSICLSNKCRNKACNE